MIIDRICRFAWTAVPLLMASAPVMAGKERPASTFGEANRQTNMAQIVNPDPQYEYLDPETSAAHAAQAIDRYRKDTVKKPERLRSTTSTTTSSNVGQ